MSRVDITIGLLAIVATAAVTALVGFGEDARMERDSRGWDARKIEVGAELFEQYCASCHGQNAVGGSCPPLDQHSGLHGGDIGPGVAWRLEELGWDTGAVFEYVQSAINAGRSLSSRPDRYPGNRLPTEGDAMPAMAMPAHGEAYGGPLRPDQVDALAHYIVAFRDAVLEDPEEALAAAQADRDEYGGLTTTATPEPSATPSQLPEGGAVELTSPTAATQAVTAPAATAAAAPATATAAPEGG